MNEQQFTILLEELEDADWQSIMDGGSLLMIDDQQLEIDPADAPNAILGASGQGPSDSLALKNETIVQAATLLANYYLTHPLPLNGFNHQAELIIEKFGAKVFVPKPG